MNHHTIKGLLLPHFSTTIFFGCFKKYRELQKHACSQFVMLNFPKEYHFQHPWGWLITKYWIWLTMLRFIFSTAVGLYNNYLVNSYSHLFVSSLRLRVWISLHRGSSQQTLCSGFKVNYIETRLSLIWK